MRKPHIDINEAIDERLRMKFIVHGHNRLVWRFKIAGLVLRLAAWIAPGDNSVENEVNDA